MRCRITASARATSPNLAELPYRASFFPIGPVFAFVLCLIITLGQNYQAFMEERIDWIGVVATYIGLPVFLGIWLAYRLIKGSHFVRYQDMKFDSEDD